MRIFDIEKIMPSKPPAAGPTLPESAQGKFAAKLASNLDQTPAKTIVSQPALPAPLGSVDLRIHNIVSTGKDPDDPANP